MIKLLNILLLIIGVSSCVGSKSDEEKMMDFINSIPIADKPDSLKIKKAEDYPLEVAFLDLLKQDSIQIDSLEILRKKGADLNIVVEVKEEYTYTKAVI